MNPTDCVVTQNINIKETSTAYLLQGFKRHILMHTHRFSIFPWNFLLNTYNYLIRNTILLTFWATQTLWSFLTRL